MTEVDVRCRKLHSHKRVSMVHGHKPEDGRRELPGQENTRDLCLCADRSQKTGSCGANPLTTSKPTIQTPKSPQTHLPDTKVARWQDVGLPQCEHTHHVRSPWADPPELRWCKLTHNEKRRGDFRVSAPQVAAP